MHVEVKLSNLVEQIHLYRFPNILTSTSSVAYMEQAIRRGG